jgi:hypothetical protein
MDARGHIYQGTEEKPVTDEDAARLDGYLRARSEADAEKKLLEKAQAEIRSGRTRRGEQVSG